MRLSVEFFSLQRFARPQARSLDILIDPQICPKAPKLIHCACEEPFLHLVVLAHAAGLAMSGSSKPLFQLKPTLDEPCEIGTGISSSMRGIITI